MEARHQRLTGPAECTDPSGSRANTFTDWTNSIPTTDSIVKEALTSHPPVSLIYRFSFLTKLNMVSSIGFHTDELRKGS